MPLGDNGFFSLKTISKPDLTATIEQNGTILVNSTQIHQGSYEVYRHPQRDLQRDLHNDLYTPARETILQPWL